MQRSEPRLNPVAFPSETKTRLLLLIVALCTLTIYCGFVLADRLGLPSPADVATLVAAASQAPAVGTAATPGGDLAYRTFLLTNFQLLGQLLVILGFPLVLCLLMLALAWLLYRLHPLLIGGIGSAQPRTDRGRVDLQQSVDELAAQVGLQPPPRVKVVGDRYQSSMRVSGFPGNFILHIGGGWHIGRLKQPDRFRAVLWHELAHIVNRDLATAYFFWALWVAFLLSIMVPTIAAIGIPAIVQAWADGWGRGASTSVLELGIVFVQAGVALAIVVAIRASLLRVRELYADWRVSLWGQGETLQALLAHQQPQPGRWPWWRAMWSYHPAPALRYESLQQPVRLFAVAPDLAFFVGFLFALLVASLPTLLNLIALILLTIIEIWQVAALADPVDTSLLVRSAAFAIPLLGLVLLIGVIGLLVAAGFFLTGTLGLESQREAVADLAVGSRRPVSARMLRIALLAAIGITTGFVFAPFNFLTIGRPSTLLFMPLWIIVLVGLLWLWCLGVYISAREVLGRHVGSRLPRGKRRLLSWFLFAMACVVWLPLLIVQQIVLPLAVVGSDLSLASAGLVILLSAALASGCFAVLALLLWLVVNIWRRVRPLRCPDCGYLSMQRYAVGSHCTRCAQSLASWVCIGSS